MGRDQTLPLSSFDDSKRLAEAKLKTASQLVGKFMEGGVLRKEDEEKYSKMLPQLTDPESTAQGKLESVRTMLQMKYNSYLTDFSTTGYDVSGFSPLEIKSSLRDITSNINNDNSDWE